MKEQTLEFKWSVSRGRDTFGYNICTLYVDGKKAARCNGGGYDMKGTCLGDFIATAYKDRLLALKPKQFPAQSHWERANPLPRICRQCISDRIVLKQEIFSTVDESVTKCPHCGNEDLHPDYQAGKRVDDGRYFYGLTFHDPDYNPSKAVIGQDCHDRTLGPGAEGKTVEQAEQAGESFGLERYQAVYRASEKQPSKRHRVPRIDGACGFRSVETIATAIGLGLRYVPTKGKTDVYILIDEKEG